MVEILLEQATYLTPTTLFLLVNVVIATILLSSALNKPPQQTPSLFSRVASFNFSGQAHEPGQVEEAALEVARAPSLLSRVTSFNLLGRGDEVCEVDAHIINNNNSCSGPSKRTLARASSLLSRVASFNVLSREEVCEVDAHFNKTTSSPSTPVVKKTVSRAPSFLSRVASFTLTQVGVSEIDAHSNYDNSNSNKNVGQQKQKTVKKSNNNKKKKKQVKTEENMSFTKNNEGEVDAKADDFINKFRQRLKFERVESLLRSRTA